MQQVFAELRYLVDEVKSADLVSPTLILIGKVVSLSPMWPHHTRKAAFMAGEVR